MRGRVIIKVSEKSEASEENEITLEIPFEIFGGLELIRRSVKSK